MAKGRTLMPRIAGQIDVAKNEAILEAALETFAALGEAPPVDEIARRAGVSKQTIYNHYGSKEDLLRAVIQRRIREITEPLRAPEAETRPEEALARFASGWLTTALSERGKAMLRATLRAVRQGMESLLHDSGPLSSRQALAQYLAAETAAGRLATPDPLEAAEFFLGMVAGARQLEALAGVGRPLTPEEVDRLAKETAMRFVRAYRA